MGAFPLRESHALCDTHHTIFATLSVIVRTRRRVWDACLFGNVIALRSLLDESFSPHMLYKTLSAAVYGIDASIIEVEVDVSGVKCDEDHFHTVGLPDAAVR